VLVLVIVDTVVVVLLAGLVAGLLRSHADILRALQAMSSAIDEIVSRRGAGSQAGAATGRGEDVRPGGSETAQDDRPMASRSPVELRRRAGDPAPSASPARRAEKT
jgi:hypothetical protein